LEGPYRQWVGYIEPRKENWREESWEEDYIGLQVQYRAFIGKGEACDSLQGGEGDSTGEGKACDGPQRGEEEAYNSPQGGNNSWDGL
jgi:hypothetical protein